MKKIIVLLFSLIPLWSLAQEGYKFTENIKYKDASFYKSDYDNERLILDTYLPEGLSDFPTLVYFHGGGLKGGNKNIPEYLKGKGIAVIAANYRFFPEVSTSVVLDDAAAAVAWTFNHIEELGGSRDKIFLSGHSAGGYLTSMLGLAKHFLANYNIDADQIAGLIPLSGHTITHMTVREEAGIGPLKPIVDEWAPLYHVRADAPPYIIITGDRELEMLGRYEENAYMWRMMQLVKHPRTELYELDGYGHMMVYPAIPIVVRKIKELTKAIDSEN